MFFFSIKAIDLVNMAGFRWSLKQTTMRYLILFAILLSACSRPDDSVSSQEPNPPSSMEEPMDLQGTPGVLQGGYGLKGTFRLADGKIIINNDYEGNTAPGPVWYLSNSPSSIIGGIYLAVAPKTAGAHELETTQAANYNYLVLWCDPFAVPIGFGQIPK